MSNYYTTPQADATLLIKRAELVLTDAQIKALPTGDLPVVPAQGEGTAIHVIAARLIIDTTAGAYTNIDASAKGLLYSGDDASSYFPVGSSGTDAFSSAGIKTIPIVSASFPDGNILANRWAAKDDVEDVSVDISVGNGAAGAFTGGHASNTMKVIVLYIVVPI